MKGGVALSQGNQSVLRFSIEESVWFQKGQEVSELISISIDPDITIQDNDLYVSIQGALQLTGEYRCHNEQQEEEEQFPAPKFVQHVEEREEGIYEFSHRFPVDISIPNSRVQSVYDIDVEVASFDYVFPERSLMKLTAEISITGLYEEEQVSSEPVDVPQPVQGYDLSPLSRPVIDDTKEEEELEEIHIQGAIEEKQDELNVPFEAVARKKPDTNENQPTGSLQEDNVEKEIPIVQVNQAQTANTPDLVISAARNDKEVEVKVPEEGTEMETDESQESESSSSSENILKKKLFSKKKKSLTLSEFFARKEDTPDLTRLKVCIVQQGETLNQLAERYEVSIQQLMRVNQLEFNQDVYVGQVLYIPVTVTRN